MSRVKKYLKAGLIILKYPFINIDKSFNITVSNVIDFNARIVPGVSIGKIVWKRTTYRICIRYEEWKNVEKARKTWCCSE